MLICVYGKASCNLVGVDLALIGFDSRDWKFRCAAQHKDKHLPNLHRKNTHIRIIDKAMEFLLYIVWYAVTFRTFRLCYIHVLFPSTYTQYSESVNAEKKKLSELHWRLKKNFKSHTSDFCANVKLPAIQTPAGGLLWTHEWKQGLENSHHNDKSCVGEKARARFPITWVRHPLPWLYPGGGLVHQNSFPGESWQHSSPDKDTWRCSQCHHVTTQSSAGSLWLRRDVKHPPPPLVKRSGIAPDWAHTKRTHPWPALL